MDIKEIFQDWMWWSLETFEKADEKVSLLKAEYEIKELKDELSKGIIIGKISEELYEYADIIMCILHSAAARGYTAYQILNAFNEKVLINKSRTWKLNEDNTYSHIK